MERRPERTSRARQKCKYTVAIEGCQDAVGPARRRSHRKLRDESALVPRQPSALLRPPDRGDPPPCAPAASERKPVKYRTNAILHGAAHTPIGFGNPNIHSGATTRTTASGRLSSNAGAMTSMVVGHTPRVRIGLSLTLRIPRRRSPRSPLPRTTSASSISGSRRVPRTLLVDYPIRTCVAALRHVGSEQTLPMKRPPRGRGGHPGSRRPPTSATPAPATTPTSPAAMQALIG